MYQQGEMFELILLTEEVKNMLLNIIIGLFFAAILIPLIVLMIRDAKTNKKYPKRLSLKELLLGIADHLGKSINRYW